MKLVIFCHCTCQVHGKVLSIGELARAIRSFAMRDAGECPVDRTVDKSGIL